MLPSGSELLLIFVVFLLLFGGKEIPDLMRKAGKWLRHVQKAAEDFKKELESDPKEKEERDKPELPG